MREPRQAASPVRVWGDFLVAVGVGVLLGLLVLVPARRLNRPDRRGARSRRGGSDQAGLAVECARSRCSRRLWRGLRLRCDQHHPGLPRRSLRRRGSVAAGAVRSCRVRVRTRDYRALAHTPALRRPSLHPVPFTCAFVAGIRGLARRGPGFPAAGRARLARRAGRRAWRWPCAVPRRPSTRRSSRGDAA